jgi:hypothetical protein
LSLAGLPCLDIGTPEAMTIRSADTQNEEAIQQDQIIATGPPAERFSQADIVKVDQEELRSVAPVQANEDIVGM